VKCIIALGKIEKVDLLKSFYLLETQRFMHFNMSAVTRLDFVPLKNTDIDEY
jgi:hypothetical protein